MHVLELGQFPVGQQQSCSCWQLPALQSERVNVAAQHDYRAKKLQTALVEVDTPVHFHNQLPRGPVHSLVAVLLTVLLILAVHHALRCVRCLERLEATMILGTQGHHQQQQQQSHIHNRSVDSGSDCSSHSSPSVVHGDDVCVISPNIAQGGFANLHAATLQGVRGIFLFKQLQQSEDSLPLLQHNIYKEAKMMHEARHPHVVKLHAVCLDNPGILIEWCRGGSLDHNNIGAQHLANAGAGAVLSALRDAAAAVCCFHSSEPDTGRPLVHNDLKGANVLLSCSEAPGQWLAGQASGWQVKVADFGLAAWLDPTCSTVPNVTNCLWVAPEVLVTQDSGFCVGPFIISRASEVWMFGMMMWEVLARTYPFEHLQEQLQQKWVPLFPHLWQMTQHCHNPHETLREFGPLRFPKNLQYGFSDSQQQLLQQLYEACTQVDPSHRPSMKEVHKQLCHICQQHQPPQQQQQSLQQPPPQGQAQLAEGLRCSRHTQMQQHSSNDSNNLSLHGSSASALPPAEVVKQQPQHPRQQVDVHSQAGGSDVQHQPATKTQPRDGSAAAKPAAFTAFIRSHLMSKVVRWLLVKAHP